MAGLSDAGLEILRLPEVIEQHNSDAQILFADLVPVGDVVDTSATTTLGRLIGLISPSEADIWAAIQQVYDAFTASGATGISLDNLAEIAGLIRQGASKSRVYVLLTGTPNTVVPVSTQFNTTASTMPYLLDASTTLNATLASGVVVTVSTVAPTTAYTLTVAWSEGDTRTFTITSSGSPTAASIATQLKAAIDADLQADMTATVQGDGTLKLDSLSVLSTGTFTVSSNLSFSQATKLATASSEVVSTEVIPANTLNIIAVPVAGLTSVNNPFEGVAGSLIETDEEFRTRFNESKYQRATNILESLYTELLGVSGVEQVVIYENDTDVTDAKGVLPHSFLVLITGGFTQDIAQAIWNNRPIGIRSQGSIAVEITDTQGYVREVKFSRPSYVDIYVTIDIEKNTLFPADGENSIRTALFEYANALAMGQEVVYSRLYTPINSVQGHYVNSLHIGTSPSPTGTANIPTSFDQVARILPQNVIFT